MFYIGTSLNPDYPGIISGPFETRPDFILPEHHLFIKKGNKFIRVFEGDEDILIGDFRRKQEKSS